MEYNMKEQLESFFDLIPEELFNEVKTTTVVFELNTPENNMIIEAIKKRDNNLLHNFYINGVKMTNFFISRTANFREKISGHICIGGYSLSQKGYELNVHSLFYNIHEMYHHISDLKLDKSYYRENLHVSLGKKVSQ